MKKVMSSLTAIIIAVFLSGNVYSQNSFSIHVGPSFPLSDFGEEPNLDTFFENPRVGGAGAGLIL